jgi:hypothetical protein
MLRKKEIVKSFFVTSTKPLVFVGNIFLKKFAY